MREAAKDDRSYVGFHPPRFNLGGLPYKTDKLSIKQNQANSTTNLASWTDPSEISQILDFFATPHLRNVDMSTKYSPSLQVHSTYSSDNSRGCSFDSERAMDPMRTTCGYASSNMHSFSRESAFGDATPKKMPPKAQRLMGIDTTMTFHRSTFDKWEDEEELQSATGSPMHRKSFYRMSKGDARLFRSSPTKKSISPKRLSGSNQSGASSVDMASLPPINRDNSSTTANSKWSNLSQRFRNNSTAPIPSRLKRTNSSPSKANFDQVSKKEKDALQMASPTRNVNTVDIPFQTSTSLLQQKSSEQKNRIAWERSEWAEARASGKALNNILDNHREDAKIPSAASLTRQHSSDSASSDIPLQILRGTPPLSFNPNRRPRAPFPLKDQVDHYSSTDEEKRPNCSSTDSPLLARCPSKMKLPSRMNQPGPSTPPKDQTLPSRPRRPTESNIFADTNRSSPVRATTAMQSRNKSTPPRCPPPTVPVPPLPSQFASNLAKEKVEPMVKEAGKLGALKAALDIQSAIPPLSISQSLKMEESPECSPQTIVFCGEKISEPFQATVKQPEGAIGANKDAWVELFVAGVQFETPLSILLSGDEQAADNRLVACIRNLLGEEKKEVNEVSLSVPIYPDSRQRKNTVNSYDNRNSLTVSSSSSEEDESEEEFQHALTFQTMSLSRMNWTLENEGIKLDESLQLTLPFRSLSHSRTPTSVSLDCDSTEGGEEQSCDAVSQRYSATPELVGPHTFIFTTSSPSSKEKHSKSIIGIKTTTAALQVTLNRDPQPYPFILHLLKHGSLPSYFGESSFPLVERKRALCNLSNECQWLGYVGLVHKCSEMLDVLL